MYKALIVDDEPWSREVVKALGNWNGLGINVVGEAEDGTEGLKLIEELEPDIILTDMRMPGIDGVEFLKIMNERFPYLKIIVMSGYDDFAYLKQAIRSHAAEYLLKPVDPSELNAALEQCVNDLKEKNPAKENSLIVPLPFEDSSALEKYTAFRKLIGGYLLDLNKAAVTEAFNRLEEFLENTLRDDSGGRVPARICHDFLALLEEFLSGSEIKYSHIWNGKNKGWAVNSGWGSIKEMIADVKWLYENAIEAAIKLQKNKSSLDLKEVQRYIEKNYQEQISLDSVSQRFFVSREHLSRAFKAYTGENITDYILRIRMEKAKELIMDQGLSIKYAAEMTGYTDIAYFYRVFKKYFGTTPGELRKEN